MIILILSIFKHGITEWNTLGKAQGVSDIPLNEIGRKQASDIGDRLSQEEKWDCILYNCTKYLK
ncbi:histidine phosphatase family protein [Robertmurraya massiliosenegalensis]|uniref:histidine phosphatase family protein n=1 Tax=Robertmurraya TaxID=2837507 RepID=UPI0039A6B865